jgi:hypothetical protein
LSARNTARRFEENRMNLVEQMVYRLAAAAPSFGRAISAETHFGQLAASLLAMAWFVEARDPYTGGAALRTTHGSVRPGSAL